MFKLFEEKSKHIARDCTSSGCKKCSKRHSTLLHEDRESLKEKREETNSRIVQENNPNKADNTICTFSQSKEIISPNQVLLSTALIRVMNNRGHYIKERVLLDNGSQSNFVTEEFVKKLNLKAVDDQIEIKGINQHVSRAMKSIDLKITSRFGTFGMALSCIVLPKITQNLPTVLIDKASLDLPPNIRLADPQFHVPGNIDLLIGAESFWDLISVGQIRLGKQSPILQKSLLGWLVSRPIGGSKSKKIKQTSCNLSIMQELSNTMNRFWEIEGYPVANDLNPEEEYCEKHFKETHTRQSDGRFVVKLPIKKEVLKSLTGSREVALKRFLALERKFAKNSEFKTEYVKFMQEYFQLGQMRRVTEHSSDKLRVFLPHHAVMKESSTTTKTRIVFNASCQYAQGKSLNDALYKGLVIQTDLFTIILRFCCHVYVLCADISKMYRQILVDEE